MYRYALLNLVFMAIAAAYVAYKRPPLGRNIIFTLAILCVLTAVFDSIIIGLDIVRYYPEHILGIYIGKAPIEDFAYSLVAVGLVPALWCKSKKK